jgi:hypothetical protein
VMFGFLKGTGPGNEVLAKLEVSVEESGLLLWWMGGAD